MNDAARDEILVFVGSYTQGATAAADSDPARAIHCFRLDPGTGALTPRGVVGGVVNPSFLTAHPTGRFLFAVQEIGDEARPEGAVSAFTVDGRGTLTPRNSQPSHGAAPCFVSVDRSGRWLGVANYVSGTVALLPIAPDGRLGAATSVVHHGDSGGAPAHAHALLPDPANRFALSADLGLDTIVVYRLDAAQGTLAPHARAALPRGAGPRHLAFHPTAPWLFCITELDSTITTFHYDPAAGQLDLRGRTSLLPSDSSGRSYAAHLLLDPTGRFLYASNRGHDSLAIFAVDGATGALTPHGHVGCGGKWPRHFALDPSGRWLLVANQHSGSVVTFQVDPATGALTPTDQRAAVPAPTCVLPLRLGAVRAEGTSAATQE